MTFTNAPRRSPISRAMPLKAGACGLLAGLLAAFSAVHAAPSPGVPVASFAQVTPAVAIDPAKQVPAAVAITGIDFKRGEGGSGKLILKFSGDGAAPDLRTQGGTVILDVGNAELPVALQRPLNVADFATPVQRINANQGPKGTQIVLSTEGAFEPLAYQTGRDYIVEIVPRAANASRAVGASTAAAVATTAQASARPGTETRSYGGRPVTFNFQDVPVRTVLQLIAELSDLNIVASDSVTGNVTLRLINVPWDQALDIVLQAKSLDKRRSGNVVWVAPQSEIAKFEQDIANARLALEERAEMSTEYIPISYGSAEDIAKLLTDESKNSQGGGGGQGASSSRGFLSSRGSLSFDRRTNTLLVIDIPQRVEEIKRLVATLDKPVDQVVIESRIVIANESFARDLGARFGVRGTKDRLITSGSLDSNTELINSTLESIRDPDGDLPTWGPLGQALNSDFNINSLNPASIAFTILGNTIDWDFELQALQEEQRGEVVSNPRVVTSNQREAIIRQGREVGYLTVTGGQSNNVPTVQFKEALLELKVTPTITADGRVFLNLAVKKDEIQDFTTIAGFGSVPNLAKREVTTAVLIEDGQTVVIGGVYEFSDRNSISKVPFLGDLPILGNLFKTKSRSKSKAELLIFVTPRVLRVAPRPY
ncbi:type IV pilus secretin PilQ [Luteimonas sp. MC1825]|uniref:type IV pilus secretin PilQ n=1 Tax=Luteimonas sp. MC1825 TaxID=2761107 RepID=UPI0016077AD4|nr:type IV pilus secretin PilQ [Luteimonas sp. MC1825]MBB6600085.1 type IV pilus secretin PilQ [Luteimonas sp. MC1825]QOC87785.1 type IV pilus secretin PilQ [Luteimonas sp. MC1825]